jgi:hypothetical protein
MKDSISYEINNEGADKTYSLGVFTYKLKRSYIVAVILLCNIMVEVNAEPDMLQTRSSAAQSQHSPAPGVFQRLIKIKYSSELYLITKAKESNRLNRPETLDSALAVYNTIRWNLDGLVYQLSGDLVAANSPKLLRRLDFQTLESIEAICTIYIPGFSPINERKSTCNQKHQPYHQCLLLNQRFL